MPIGFIPLKAIPFAPFRCTFRRRSRLRLHPGLVGRTAETRVLVMLVVVSTISLGGETMAISGPLGSLSAPSWHSVREQTTCEAMRDDYCFGRYGFTVTDDGSFIAGPSPSGNKAEGRIQPQKLQHLRELIVQLFATMSSEDKSWKLGGPPGIKDQLDITFSEGGVVRVYDRGSTIGKLYYVGSWERVRDLHEYFHELMAQYYPVPFPLQ
jgi:hypothetical protein